MSLICLTKTEKEVGCKKVLCTAAIHYWLCMYYYGLCKQQQAYLQIV